MPAVGLWTCYTHLRMQGYAWNQKRVQRVYCGLRLHIPRRTTRRVPKRVRHPLAAPPRLNQTWALDFMSETLYDGRRVARHLDELVALHGCPAAIRVDNGPEFTAQPFVDWCAEHGGAIHYLQPGKPDQNAYIERFDRTSRTEGLNAHLFESIAALRAMTDTRLRLDNAEQPHDSLSRVPPLTFRPRPTTAAQSPSPVST